MFVSQAESESVARKYKRILIVADVVNRGQRVHFEGVIAKALKYESKSSVLGLASHRQMIPAGLDRLEDAVEIARLQGAECVLIASTPEAGRADDTQATPWVVFTARVIDTNSGKIIWRARGDTRTQRYDGSMGQMMKYAAVELSKKMRDDGLLYVAPKPRYRHGVWSRRG